MTIYCRRALFGVQVKLWPGVHCLQCLSFNGSFDIMNEGVPPSVPQKEPVLSEPITARRIVFFVLFNEVNSHTTGRNSSERSRLEDDEEPERHGWLSSSGIREFWEVFSDREPAEFTCARCSSQEMLPGSGADAEDQVCFSGRGTRSDTVR